MAVLRDGNEEEVKIRTLTISKIWTLRDDSVKREENPPLLHEPEATST